MQIRMIAGQARRMSDVGRIAKAIRRTSEACWHFLHSHRTSYYVGGVLSGIAVSVLFASLHPRVAVFLCILIVVLAGVVGTLGRLAEKSGKRLLAPEKYYREFFENAIEGIFCSTPDGHYIAINHALAKIYGYPSREALANSLTDIASQLYVDPNRRDEFKTIMEKNDWVTGFVSEIRRQDGSNIWISENARAVRDWSGQLVCYQGTVEDVTDRVCAQKLHRALREAEEVNRAKGAFLATMTHELRTPLNAIIGFSEIIVDEVLGPIRPPSYRDYATDIHGSGVRLLALVNDVLDATRLECGSLVVDPMPHEIGGLIEDAISKAHHLVGDSHRISVHIEQGLPKFLVDGARFVQCLAKVLTNALKFTQSGGEIAVSAGLGTGGGLDLSVKDTGIGIEPEKLTNLTQLFHQLDGTLSRRFGGLGLGLFIAKSLIALHDGTLTIDSAKGKGTTVAIALPPARTLMPVAGAA
jgi:PAS domain S-box-containing protein